MELAEATSDGQQCFKYTHSAAYHVRVPNSLEKAATCLSYASAERYYLVTHSVLSHKIKWICVSAPINHVCPLSSEYNGYSFHPFLALK